MSEPALAVGSDEVVLLVAQAAEALELLYLVIVEKVLELALAPPQVYQLGNEVDTWLDGKHETGFQGTCQTQGLETEGSALGMTVVADPHLAQVLHVVYVQAQHVAQAAGEEHGVSTLAGHLGRISGHKTDALEVGCDGLRHLEVNLPESDAGPEGIHRNGMSVQGHIVYHLLLLSETLADRSRRGEVAGIVQGTLGTGIEQEEVSLLKDIAVIVVVQGLSVDGGDDRE